jgi:hypothetical protein
VESVDINDPVLGFQPRNCNFVSANSFRIQNSLQEKWKFGFLDLIPSFNHLTGFHFSLCWGLCSRELYVTSYFETIIFHFWNKETTQTYKNALYLLLISFVKYGLINRMSCALTGFPSAEGRKASKQTLGKTKLPRVHVERPQKGIFA